MTLAVLSRFDGLLHAWSMNLWQACWQGGLLVLVIWAAVRLLPSVPARCQCWLWRLAMLKFVVVLSLPALVDVPLLPATTVAAQTQVQFCANGAVPSPQAARAPVAPVETSQWFGIPTVLRFLWLLGAGYSFLRLGVAWSSACRLKRQGKTITDGPIVEQLGVQSRLFGLRTAPKLVEVPGGGSPMLLGMLRPTIVMPTGTHQRLNVQEQAMVFGHELAHIHHGDIVWGVVASLVRSLFFFHPLAWLCQRQLRLAQEIAADELAIAKQNHDPIRYGSLLVSVIEKIGLTMGSRPLVSAISLETAGPVHSLTRRLVAMSRIDRASRWTLISSSVLFGAVAMFGLVPWRLVAAEPKTDGGIDQPQNFYQAKIRVNASRKDQPAEQIMAPTLVCRAGQTAFVSMSPDKTEMLMVAVASSSDVKPKHWIQARLIMHPEGKMLAANDIRRFVEEDTKHIRIPDQDRKGCPVRGRSGLTIAHSVGSFELVVTLGCDQDARAIPDNDYDKRHGYVAWHSDWIEAPTDSTSTIRVNWRDGSRRLKIDVSVSPTENPKALAGQLQAHGAPTLKGQSSDRPLLRVGDVSYVAEAAQNE